jgi:hypothetical protein
LTNGRAYLRGIGLESEITSISAAPMGGTGFASGRHAS